MTGAATLCVVPGCPYTAAYRGRCLAHSVKGPAKRGSTWRWRRQRQVILRRDDYVCWICLRSGADSVDHVTPVKHGGTDDASNLRAAHLTCNQRRGAARGL
jgi:5-methylcytosine-specific restriction endonuclease McrA